MNKHLLERKYDEVALYLKYGFRAIDTNDYELPVELWPNEAPGDPNSNDPWEAWEAEKFEKKWPYCVAHWNKVLGLAKRIKKLEQNRLVNENYCNKTDHNINKYIDWLKIFKL